MGDFLPTVAESHAVGLFLEVGVLPARHFVEVNLSSAASGSGIKRFVVSQNFFPVIGKLVESFDVEARVSLVATHRGADRV